MISYDSSVSVETNLHAVGAGTVKVIIYDRFNRNYWKHLGTIGFVDLLCLFYSKQNQNKLVKTLTAGRY